MVTIAHSCAICGIDILKPKRGPIGKTCSPKCRQKLVRQRARTGVTGFVSVNHQKTCDTRPKPAYSANAIRILSDSECKSDLAFDWKWAQQLAKEYCRPVEWIERGFKACRKAGVKPEYFIDRYLHRKPVAMNADVDQAFRKLIT